MSATATALRALEPSTPRVNIEDLDQLVKRQLPKFYRQAYRQLENSHDAEDAVQDALVSAYKNLSQFRGTAQLSTWLMAIVINTARMQLRRRRRLVSFEDQPIACEKGATVLDIFEDKQPNPEENCVNSELRSLLAKAMTGLSPALREATEFYYVDGMTAAQASEALGVPVGTIKARLARSRAKLAKLLGRESGRRVPAPR